MTPIVAAQECLKAVSNWQIDSLRNANSSGNKWINSNLPKIMKLEHKQCKKYANLRSANMVSAKMN